MPKCDTVDGMSITLFFNSSNEVETASKSEQIIKQQLPIEVRPDGNLTLFSSWQKAKHDLGSSLIESGRIISLNAQLENAFSPNEVIELGKSM